MSQNNINIAEGYYKAMGEKDLAMVAKYVHPDVQFIAPLSQLSGREAVLEAAKKFITLFQTLKIRSSLGAGDQAVVVYDLECPAPIGTFSTAVLMTIKEDLIAKIELFFDARPFERK